MLDQCVNPVCDGSSATCIRRKYLRLRPNASAAVKASPEMARDTLNDVGCVTNARPKTFCGLTPVGVW